MALVLAVALSGCSQTSSVQFQPHRTTTNPSDLVLANNSGSDMQVISTTSGRVITDLGAIPGYTNNGLALAPNSREIYATVIGSSALMIDRIDVATGKESFVADGVLPSISQSGRFLAYVSQTSYASGAQELVVQDLVTGTTRSINLQRLLGAQTDLFNASIAWLGSKIVVVPGGVASDLMPRAEPTPLPKPLKGSCSAVPYSESCVIEVDTQAGHHFRTQRFVVNQRGLSGAVLEASGSSTIAMATFNGNGTDVYRADLGAGPPKITRLFTVRSALPLAFSSGGTELFFLRIGHPPIALWSGKVADTELENTKILNRSVSPAGVAS
jgi:hypothetical protein